MKSKDKGTTVGFSKTTPESYDGSAVNAITQDEKALFASVCKEHEWVDVLNGIVSVIHNPNKDDKVNLAKFVGWAVISKNILENYNSVHEINAIKYPDFYKSNEKDLIIAGLTEGAEQWKAEYDNCRAILENLVELKNWKDQGINIHAYAARKPSAWEAARMFLEQYQHQ